MKFFILSSIALSSAYNLEQRERELVAAIVNSENLTYEMKNKKYSTYHRMLQDDEKTRRPTPDSAIDVTGRVSQAFTWIGVLAVPLMSLVYLAFQILHCIFRTPAAVKYHGSDSQVCRGTVATTGDLSCEVYVLSKSNPDAPHPFLDLVKDVQILNTYPKAQIISEWTAFTFYMLGGIFGMIPFLRFYCASGTNTGIRSLITAVICTFFGLTLPVVAFVINCITFGYAFGCTSYRIIKKTTLDDLIVKDDDCTAGSEKGKSTPAGQGCNFQEVVGHLNNTIVVGGLAFEATLGKWFFGVTMILSVINYVVYVAMMFVNFHHAGSKFLFTISHRPSLGFYRVNCKDWVNCLVQFGTPDALGGVETMLTGANKKNSVFIVLAQSLNTFAKQEGKK